MSELNPFWITSFSVEVFDILLGMKLTNMRFDLLTTYALESCHIFKPILWRHQREKIGNNCVEFVT